MFALAARYARQRERRLLFRQRDKTFGSCLQLRRGVNLIQI
jgi:hypothetical protein